MEWVSPLKLFTNQSTLSGWLDLERLILYRIRSLYTRGPAARIFEQLSKSKKGALLMDP